jgi:class 3 adenylate cyclase/nitrite reductase/ring-hydroxylating ferredoxin subunit
MSPYDVMYLLNRYFAEIGQIIEENGGYVDKFMGDGLMAIFGIEGAPDAPVRAVNAALQSLVVVDRLKPFFDGLYAVKFDARIGLHYGEAVIGSLGSPGHERLTAVGDVVNVASRIEAANKDAGTRLLLSDALYRQVEKQVEVSDFVRTRLRGTNERITLYEITRLTPEAHAALRARERRELMRFAGRQWIRVADNAEVRDGQPRLFELEAFDLVVVRQGDALFAFNNSCPHLHLPFFEKRAPDKTGSLISPGSGREVPRDSRLTTDRGLVCRWHNSCFDLQTGEVREWCPKLQADGTSKGWEFMGDLSKNRARLKTLPSLVRDGSLWVAIDAD